MCREFHTIVGTEALGKRSFLLLLVLTVMIIIPLLSPPRTLELVPGGILH